MSVGRRKPLMGIALTAVRPLPPGSKNQLTHRVSVIQLLWGLP
jgi:hypothetical protein